MKNHTQSDVALNAQLLLNSNKPYLTQLDYEHEIE